MLMDAAIFKDTLIMSYEWPEDRQSLSWTLESSSLLKSLEARIAWRPRVLALRSPTSLPSTLLSP